MNRELRRFDVNDKCGTKYTVIERGMFATVDGCEVQVGVSTYATSTGWVVTTAATPGEYRIERLRLNVRR